MTWTVWLAIAILLAIAWFRRRAEETAERGPGGMKESLARAGAVGGTARWAAKGYKFFRQRYPEREGISDQNIFRLMIGHRYQALPDDEAERTLLAQAGGMQSLSQLVVAILRIEAGFDENTLENRQLFMDVIKEELTHAEVPDDLVSARGLAAKANRRPDMGLRRAGPGTSEPEQSASEGRMKSGDQASSVSPSNRVEQEDRVLVSRRGDEMEVSVSRVGAGRYRIEDLFRFSFWADDEVAEEAGVGWLLEVEELEDGRLRVMDVVPDPSVDSIGGLTFPRQFIQSDVFEELRRRIVELGGNWEVFGGGLFSAYVPKASSRATGFALSAAVDDAWASWKAVSGQDTTPTP